MFKKSWGVERIHKSPVINLELHTGGWSGNEVIISALLQNRMFITMWYKKWERGGHYYFEINPFNCGYMLVSKYAKEKKISRQAIFKRKDKFDWVIISDNKRLLKQKTPDTIT